MQTALDLSLDRAPESAPVALPVGTPVGAKRWSYAGAHPDCWGTPWRGVVLALNDPRAWENTLAFPGRLPGHLEVDEHVAQHTFSGRTPVLWDFGSAGLQSHWERTASLRPYADDLAAWERARAERQEECRRGQEAAAAREAAHQAALAA